jgi:hypothetical protein
MASNGTKCASQNSGRETQKLKHDERLLPVSTRRRITNSSWVGLLIYRRGVYAIPYFSPSPAPCRVVYEKYFLITVAGPRRTHTGFPVTPSRAPGISIACCKVAHCEMQPHLAHRFAYSRREFATERTTQFLPLKRRSVIVNGDTSIRQNVWAGACNA